jgi:FkbM family methyltransferase
MDRAVLEEIQVCGVYDALFSRDPGSVRRIVDLGANVGFSVRLWLERFPQAQVIAVEPDIENLRMARLNAAAVPDHGRRVTWVQACASATPGEVFLDRTGETWGYSMSRCPVGRDNDVIPAFNMEQILAMQSDPGCPEPWLIDLLKCDIEGAEQSLFADCESWIRRVRWLLLEVHQPYGSDGLLSDLRRASAQFDLQVLHHEPEHQVLLGRNLAPEAGRIPHWNEAAA